MDNGEKSLRGYWWLLDEPDKKVPGSLVISSDGRCALELVGALALSIGGSKQNAEERGDRPPSRVPHVLGMCDGAPVTLLDCFVSKQSGIGPEGKGYQDLHVHEALVGVHTSSDEPAFRQAIVTIENLSNWLGLDEYAELRGNYDDSTVSLRDFTPQSCEVEGWTITARGLAQPFSVEYEHSRLIVQSSMEGYLVLSSAQPRPLRDFHALILEFMDLITLAAGEASGQISLTLIHKDPLVTEHPGEGGRTEWDSRVESYSAMVHTANSFAKSVHDWEFRFTCRDVAFSDIVPAWLSLRRRASEACNVFFGLHYARPKYAEVHLLLVAITAEALHEALYPQEAELPAEDFKRIRDGLLATLDNLEEKKWAKAKLRNAPSFIARLHSLAAKPNPDAFAQAVGGRDEWARRLKNARNRLAHTGNETSEADLFELTRRTTDVLVLVLLAELGTSPEAQLRAAKRGRLG